MSTPSHGISFALATRVFAYIGINSFGGPAGQISVMHRELVERRRWVSEERFLHAMNFCMLLPGPEAMQLATYMGWLLHGVRGGLIAGLLFILPGFLSILALSIIYSEFGDVGVVRAVFAGVAPTVVAIVAEAVVKIGKKSLKTPEAWALAGASFLAIFLLDVPFPALVAGAALIGFLSGNISSKAFMARGSSAAPTALDAGPVPAVDQAALNRGRPSPRSTFGTLVLWLAVWFVPIGMLALWVGPSSVLVDLAMFFSQASVVTFGGAYAVLGYVAQEGVANGWVTAREMLDGLALAETTPGPLIMVLQFVGYFGAHGDAGLAARGLAGVPGGILASIVTVWVTFVPCFLWVFLGAPYVEWLRGKAALSRGLTAITASVVGVVLNLGVWFGLHTLFGEVGSTRVGPFRVLTPTWSNLDVIWAGVALAAGVALIRFRAPMMAVLAGGALVGVVRFLAAG